jgi:hypothetical protein
MMFREPTKDDGYFTSVLAPWFKCNITAALAQRALEALSAELPMPLGEL